MQFKLKRKGKWWYYRWYGLWFLLGCGGIVDFALGISPVTTRMTLLVTKERRDVGIKVKVHYTEAGDTLLIVDGRRFDDVPAADYIIKLCEQNLGVIWVKVLEAA